MAKFQVEGKSYDTENFSEHQKSVVNSLSVTKNLIADVTYKNELFTVIRQELEKSLKKKFGSKIKAISDNKTDPFLSLANGKKIKFEEIEKKAFADVVNLSFINEQITYYNNLLQVLDTAVLAYSKSFYETIKGAE